MAALSPRQDFRLLVVAGAAAAAGLAVACCAQRARARRERSRRKKALGGPSLADEIKEALQREAEELRCEPPDEALQAEFAQAIAWVGLGGSGLSTDAKLGLYGCYKQVTVGDAPEKKPWGGMEASMKWDAWNSIRGKSRCEAISMYIEILDNSAPTWHMEDPSKMEADSDGGKYEGTGMGPAVSTMGMIGSPEEVADTDDTPVGQLCAKIAEGDAQGACALLQRQPRLAFQEDKDGMVPLHWAADRGDLEMAAVLIRLAGDNATPEKKAACLNARDSNGDTPLHYAVNTDNPEFARLLLAAGADPTAKNADGETPAELAEADESMAAAFGAA